MRSHGGSGEGTRLARAAAVAGDVAHRAASTGGFSRWLIEPFGHSYHARIAAGTFAGVEPLLPRRGKSGSTPANVPAAIRAWKECPNGSISQRLKPPVEAA